MTDAYQRFLKLRWPPDGRPVCPRCGSTKFYDLSTRAKFKCAYCKKHFSATSGTIFNNRKLSYEKLMALLEYKELNALRISREMGIQYRAAWTLCGKLREMHSKSLSLGDQTDSRLRGYYQGSHAGASCCGRCGKSGVPLTRDTFNIDKKTEGFFCSDCYNRLSELQREFRENYKELRIIKEFEEELNDHTEHG